MLPRSIEDQAHGVLVRWGPSDALPAGIRILEHNKADTFVPWADLKVELETRLLPQLFKDPQPWCFEKLDLYGKKDWLVQIQDKAGERFCDVWFGESPPKWILDGLVKVGTAEEEPHIWQSYERYSDGSYRRKQALCWSLDEMIQPWRERKILRASDAARAGKSGWGNRPH